jgi:hypothetical protein
MVLNESITAKISEKVQVLLVRQMQPDLDISEDYELKKYCDGKIKIEKIDTNHHTIIRDDKMVDFVNDFIK